MDKLKNNKILETNGKALLILNEEMREKGIISNNKWQFFRMLWQYSIMIERRNDALKSLSGLLNKKSKMYREIQFLLRKEDLQNIYFMNERQLDDENERLKLGVHNVFDGDIISLLHSKDILRLNDFNRYSLNDLYGWRTTKKVLKEILLTLKLYNINLVQYGELKK